MNGDGKSESEMIMLPGRAFQISIPLTFSAGSFLVVWALNCRLFSSIPGL